MKIRSLFVVFILAFLAIHQPVKASHIFGGELLYRHDTGNNYKIVLTLYGDCSSVPAFSYLYVSRPIITVSNGAGSFNTILDADTGSNVEVSPVCPSQIGHTTCDTPGGTTKGVKRFIFSNTVNLPSRDSNWQFIFTGDLDNNLFAGRSMNITNINNAGNTYMYLVATLNNLTAPNSSPIYSTIPTPFYCINVAEQYNQGAIDIDNDSLAFSLIGAIDGNQGTQVQYISPLSGTTPISAVSGTFSFNPVNGQLNFTSTDLQEALVVNKVSEYRNGVLVGSSMREMTFIILDNCIGTPPGGNIDPNSVNGGTIKVQNGTTVNICAGTPNLSFDIKTKASSGDTVNLLVNNSISNSSINIISNNTNNPSLHFNWQSGTFPPGIYNFYVTMKDNHCPVADIQTIAYTINIVEPYTLSDSQVSATQCVHQAAVHYHMQGGILPHTLTVMQASSTINTFTDTSAYLADSLAAGTYTLIVSSPYLNCSVTENLTIVDSGKLPAPSDVQVSYCRNDLFSGINYPLTDGATVKWYDINGNNLLAPPIVNTTVPNVYTWYVSQQYKTCNSGIDTFQATVHDLPKISFPNMPQSVCIGDTIALSASGGIDYTWGPSDQVFESKNSTSFTRLIIPQTYHVTVKTEYGCVDSSTYTISDIEPCCQFSYPNAFTPNGDNKNDKFRPVIYGHTQEYEFSVYTRWGKRVFHTFNQYASWDGTSDGVPCAMDTYYFFVVSKCLSGKEEHHKGDVILIR